MYYKLRKNYCISVTVAANADYFSFNNYNFVSVLSVYIAYCTGPCDVAKMRAPDKLLEDAFCISLK